MSLSLHNQKSIKNVKPAKRKGRGNASGKGTYAARGLKGQKARSGGKSGLKLKGMKANLQNMPKLPGFNSLRPELQEVTLHQLEATFKAGEKVTPESLKRVGLINSTQIGVKILGTGKLTKKLLVIVDNATASAQDAIQKAGGTIKVLKKAKVAPQHTEAQAGTAEEK
jgi:large subunit ribosomal protein L15